MKFDVSAHLCRLIAGGLTRIEEIGIFLDNLDHADRMKGICGLKLKEMKALFERAREAEPITLDHFVPKSTADANEVIHEGLNSLPAFRRFQKRFCRSFSSTSGLPAVFGYNEGPTRPLIGPGYFVAHETREVPHWAARGAVVVDYHMIPDGPVAQGWPEVIPNEQGLQQMVFSKTRDFMRRVSTHVSIGEAFKYESRMGAYFILCRS